MMLGSKRFNLCAFLHIFISNDLLATYDKLTCKRMQTRHANCQSENVTWCDIIVQNKCCGLFFCKNRSVRTLHEISDYIKAVFSLSRFYAGSPRYTVISLGTVPTKFDRVLTVTVLPRCSPGLGPNSTTVS